MKHRKSFSILVCTTLSPSLSAVYTDALDELRGVKRNSNERKANAHFFVIRFRSLSPPPYSHSRSFPRASIDRPAIFGVARFTSTHLKRRRSMRRRESAAVEVDGWVVRGPSQRAKLANRKKTKEKN